MEPGVVLAYLYPGADPSELSVAKERGEEARITHFDEGSLGPQPTQAELEEAYLPAIREQKRTYIRAEVNRRASGIMPIWEFVYLTSQGISDPRMSDLQDIARRGRELEAYIDDPARTVEEIEAITWS